MEKRVVFSGNSVSSRNKTKLKSKINKFLETEFEHFRDRAEEERASDYRINCALRTFGDSLQCFDIKAVIIEEGSVEFQIYDYDRDDVIVFTAHRLNGNLEEVFVLHDDISYILSTLDLLNKPSWIN